MTVLGQVDAWKAFFDTYGIVVVRNVLSDEECDATVDEMWESVAPLGMDRTVRALCSPS